MDRVFLKADNHAWERREIDFSVPGFDRVYMERATPVVLELRNIRCQAYARLNLPARVYVRRKGWVGDIATFDISVPSSDASLGLGDLVAGPYVIEVELGDWHDPEGRITLGATSESISLSKGEHVCSIVLEDPPHRPMVYALNGKLCFSSTPPEDCLDSMEIRLYSLASRSQAGPDARIVYGQMMREDNLCWSWSVDHLPVGTYQVRVEPFVYNDVITHSANANSSHVIDVPDLARVRVDIVSGSTRVSVSNVHWGRLGTDFAMRNFYGMTASGASGSAHFWTTPGDIWVSVFASELSREHGFSRQEFKVTAGDNNLVMRIKPVCGFEIVLKRRGTVIPIGRLHKQLRGSIRWSGGGSRAGTITISRLSTHGIVEVSAPGNYEISVLEIAAELAEHSDLRRTVRAERGVIKKVVFELK
ncbi:MAG: hypothetical protein DHS20C16_33680 [Phycisphaerae bacterium]|nr:MAG: hypothetical protein DHS20C16_33680 [Phycisphaerae bacterium]